jgi:hypothetical protein
LIGTQKRDLTESSGFYVYDGANGRYLEPSSFIDAVAPTEEGFNRISRQQYSIREFIYVSGADISV